MSCEQDIFAEKRGSKIAEFIQILVIYVFLLCLVNSTCLQLRKFKLVSERISVSVYGIGLKYRYQYQSQIFFTETFLFQNFRKILFLGEYKFSTTWNWTKIFKSYLKALKIWQQFWIKGPKVSTNLGFGFDIGPKPLSCDVHLFRCPWLRHPFHPASNMGGLVIHLTRLNLLDSAYSQVSIKWAGWIKLAGRNIFEK